MLGCNKNVYVRLVARILVVITLLPVLIAVITRPCLVKQRKAKRKNKAATVAVEV